MKTSDLKTRYLKKILGVEYRALLTQKNFAALMSWQKIYYCEAILSDLWQTWGDFNRCVLITSCNGISNSAGTHYAKRPGDNTWQRVGYEAQCAAKRMAVIALKKNSSQRQEPTWGDIDKIIDIINVLAPRNRSHLLTSYGIGLQGPKYLQITRNACFHKHNENIDDVRRMTINYYSTSKFNTPIDIMWYIDTVKNTNAIYSWIDDIKKYISIICN